MAPLLRSEIFRLTRRGMPRILLLILGVAVVALYLLFWTLVRTRPEGTSPGDIEAFRQSLRLDAVRETGMSLVQSVGSVLVVILAASMISTEFSWGTIRTILPRASSRSALITAKLIVLVAFVVLLAVLGFVIALAASALVSALENLGGSVADAIGAESLAAVGRTAFVMFPYMALGFVVALWTRSTAAGISIGLSVLFLENVLVGILGTVGGPLAWLPDLLLSRNVAAVMQANSPDTGGPFGAPPANLPDAWRAAGILALYTVLFIALAYWRFRDRDITAS